MKSHKDTQDIEFVRNSRIVSELTLVDGLLRSGKSAVGPILGSFDRVEIIRSEPLLETIPLFYHLDKIAKDAAIALLRREIDIRLYNSMISRNTNFRIGDFTGVFNNTNTFKYLKRLFLKDGDIVVERIKKERPIFQAEVHDMLQFIDLYFEAFGKGLRVIEMVRHPLELLHEKNVIRYAAFLEKNSRGWQLNIKNKKGHIPYYALGWADEFVNESPLNRAIKIVHRLTKQMISKYESLSSSQKHQVLFIPFEKFATFPHKYLDLISNFIGSEVTGKTKQALKKQKVPRVIDPKVKENKMKLIKEKISKECLGILDDLINTYEQKYLIP